MCLVELVGPSRFSHWDEKGQPVGEAHPQAWVQVTAVNQSQTTNTMALIPSLVSDLMRETYQIIPGAVLIRAMGGRVRLEAVTSSYRSLEGKRTTFTLLNEALALDTPIPTPGGWTTMGELSDGDVIYGADGLPTTVTKAHDVQVGRDCFRVYFDDGSSIVASDGHWWKVRVAKNRRCTVREMTTREMFDAGREFYLPESFVDLATDEAELPIHPYILGLWLGDGAARSAQIATDAQDRDELVGIIQSLGESVSNVKENHFRISGGCRSAKRTSLVRRLRDMGLIQNKHIPQPYLRASRAQRLELLRGLMDSDGSVRRGGHARFSNANPAILSGTRELLISLGYHVNEPAFQIRDGDRAHWLPMGTISFKAIESVNPFRLSRKARVVKGEQSPTRDRLRRIVKIEPVESVPVRCITVSAEDHLFLAGKGMHTTRNTHHWISGNNGHKMYETIDGNATKKDSRYLAITNAYLPGEDSVAERMREAWERIEDGKAADIGFLYDSLEAHEKTPLTPDALRIVLPKIRGDSIWLRPETIIQSILDTTISASRSRRMWLNQVVAEEDALYVRSDWDAQADPALTLKHGDQIVLGFDGGKTDDATALVAMRVADRAAFLIGLWEKPDGPNGDGWIVPRELVDEAVRNAIAVFDVQGFYCDVALWESYISEWSRDFKEGFTVKSSAQDGISFDMRSSQQKVTRAHERLVQAILDGKILHTGDRDLRRHVLNTRRRTNVYGLSFGKESKDSPKKIDAYAALLLAHECLHDFLTRGKPAKKRSGRGYFL